MILAKNLEDAKSNVLGKILNESKVCKSRFGEYIFAEPTFIVIKSSEHSGVDFDYDICGDNYENRIKDVLKDIVKKLKETPFTRRASIPIWRPKDHKCRNPAAITEISFLVVDSKLHLTSYIRSLDCLNYFEPVIDLISFVHECVCNKTEFDIGSLAILVGIPHIYKREINKVDSSKYKEVFGYTELGTHIVDDYISSAWHTALDTIVNHGKRKQTEWGEFFDGQTESLFIHRMFIEVRKPEENKIHDKAPFTEKYGIEYAHNYVIYAAKINEPVNENILRPGEEYTYAERARYCERDEIKVDQLYEVIQKLKSDKCRRDCYIGISRPWDVLSTDPPCLRGYQFIGGDELRGIFYMRSNDAYGAMHANMYAFSLLTKYVAELTGYRRYKYYHFALDAHIYAEFIKTVKEILYPESPQYSDFV